MLEEARIRKLHRALSVSHAFRRNTQCLFDYLRVSDSYCYWSEQAAEHEKRIQQKGDESIEIDLDANPHALVMKHLQKTGITMTGSLEDFIREAGFGTTPELITALKRDHLGDSNA